jgi:hypothetical protein
VQYFIHIIRNIKVKTRCFFISFISRKANIKMNVNTDRKKNYIKDRAMYNDHQNLLYFKLQIMIFKYSIFLFFLWELFI